jgi:hypothetical protein
LTHLGTNEAHRTNGTTTKQAMTVNWTHATPQELVTYAEMQADAIRHDQYVWYVAVATSFVAMAVILVVVQQLVENPHGFLAKFCRCLVALVRILCWPIRLVCCCRTDCGFSNYGHVNGSDRRTLDCGPAHERVATTDRDMEFS